MQKWIRKWLGIDDLLAESAKWNRELSSFSGRLEALRDEDVRLRRLISEKFSDLLPASPEFIDEIRRQLEAKVDQSMLACDRIADEMKRSRLRTGV